MEEEWKDVVGYEGLYQISSLGRVKSLNYHRSGREQILKTQINKKGYVVSYLYKDGKSKTCQVHRLVAEAFIGECPEGCEVDHINTIRDDNRVENLRYCTPKENSNNPLSLKAVRKHIKKLRKILSKPIQQLTMDGELVNEYPSLSEACRETGFPMGNISNCCHGHSHYKHAYGYKWKYKNG